MRRLANAAGCSTMVFYSAFGTKAGLLRALAAREAERWIDAATTLADPDPRAWLDAVAARCAPPAVERPHHRALLFDPRSGPRPSRSCARADRGDRPRGARDAAADGVAEALWSGWVGALAADDEERFAACSAGSPGSGPATSAPSGPRAS
jgi:AcrR family transcriptional regulator